MADITPKPPIFDLSALSALQTVLEPPDGLVDPWGVKLAGSFANLLIYSDNARVIVPGTELESGLLGIQQPSVIRDVAAVGDGFLAPVPYSTSEHLEISDQAMREAAVHFDRFARRNKPLLKEFCKLHLETAFVRMHQSPRVKTRRTYKVDAMATDPMLLKLSKFTNLHVEALLYAFDLALRFPFYGQLAGSDSFYLNHPIRDAFEVKAKSESKAVAPPIPLSFADPMRHIAKHMTRDEYFTTLRILREKVRELGIHGMPAGQLNRETVREIAAAARFRPRLRSEDAVWEFVKTVMAASLGLATVPLVGPLAGAAVIGASVAVSRTVWKNGGKGPLLPQGMGTVSWLRWAVRWDIEKQAEGGDQS